jgi:hypothetical protein
VSTVSVEIRENRFIFGVRYLIMCTYKIVSESESDIFVQRNREVII